MLNIKLAAIAALLLFATANAQDCSKDKPCDDGSCCSQWGYCGTTTEYCGNGCLANCTLTISTNAECGSVQSTKCPDSQCCSKWGWCGYTDEYCGVGCQAGFGNCGLDSALPVSTDAQCGPGVGKRCSDSLCCSQYGWCGSTSDYCDAGCQLPFGKCSDVDDDDDDEVCDTDDNDDDNYTASVADITSSTVSVAAATYSTVSVSVSVADATSTMTTDTDSSYY